MSLQWCLTLCYGPLSTKLLCPWDFPGKNTGVGCHALLQGIFPTQGLNLHLLCLVHWEVGSLPLAPPGKPNLFYTLLIKIDYNSEILNAKKTENEPYYEV